MREFGKISSSIWRSKRWRRILAAVDGDVSRARLAKSAYFCLHTSVHGNSIGAYVMPPELAALDMQEPVDELIEAYRTLQEVGLIRYDEDEWLLQIVGFLEFNGFTSRKHLAGSLKIFHSLPDCRLKDLVAADIVMAVFHRTQVWKTDLVYRSSRLVTPKDQKDYNNLTEARAGFLEDASKLIQSRGLIPILAGDEIALPGERKIALSDELSIDLSIHRDKETEIETETQTETQTQTETETALDAKIQADIAELTQKEARQRGK